MEQHPELGFAFCDLDVVDETDIEKIKKQILRKPHPNENLITDLIERKNIVWTPIGNIFRSKNFIETVPSKQIYEGKGGQNFQMLFPMACTHKHGYIKESLGKYVERQDSHSRQKKQKEEREYELLSIWLNTINNLSNINNQTKLSFLKTTFNHFFTPALPRVKLKNKALLTPFIKIKERRNDIKIYLFGIHILTIWR